MKTTADPSSDLNFAEAGVVGQGHRKDRFGNLIKHEGGQHPKKFKVTFIDKILWVPISDVHEVESYKMYNAQSIKEEKEANESTACCVIF